MKSSGQIIMFQNIVTISENNKRFSLKKMLDNWFVIVILCMTYQTGKIAIEQFMMYAKFRAIEISRER